MLYRDQQLRTISFPLGGIGTGSVGLAGNGRLMDWEIFNRPNKGSVNGYSHMALRCKAPDGRVTAKVLHGDLTDGYVGQYAKSIFQGYGYGPFAKTMAGFPHFRQCRFRGEFPFAEISLQDEDFPAMVKLTAFNPFIPLDADNSSLPAAFFEIAVTNVSPEETECTVAFSLENPFEHSRNVWNGSQLTFFHETACDSVEYGDLTLACCGGEPSHQEYWYRGGWHDGIIRFWKEFTSPEGLRKRRYDCPGSHDTGTLTATARIAAGDTKTIRFLLSWNVPNNYNYWGRVTDESGRDITWKNYYATLFKDSACSARYCMERWDSLLERTRRFKDSLFDTTLDEAVIDRISANLSVLKSPTVLRLEDGSFYGWEGVHEEKGSCEGTCQHVWNYAYALCFLFPDLERSIRDLELRYSTHDNGQMEFRMCLPIGAGMMNHRACVDGQMGTILKIYRDWKITGNSQWLRDNWETIVKILEYAWSPENPDQWDLNRDGVLEGRQHHTLDMELFGPSSWLEGFYLGALKAAAQMAEFLGDTSRQGQYEDLFAEGAAWTRENLFNGSYFIHKVDLTDRRIIERFDCPSYWNEETGELKYQIGEGSSIDQLCAQWHADISHLGNIFDREQTQTALRTMYRLHFKRTMRDHVNFWRLYSLNDEQGAVICDYPEGAYQPAIPVPYCEETMTGFEYQFAGLLMGHGMVEEGLEVVRAICDRFDGTKRNPWNEFECGSNYARSMASFALLPILSGFTFDLPHGQIGFDPVGRPENFRCFWSLGTGWGVFQKTPAELEIRIYEGSLRVGRVELRFASHVHSLEINGRVTGFMFRDNILQFPEQTVTESLRVGYS